MERYIEAQAGGILTRQLIASDRVHDESYYVINITASSQVPQILANCSKLFTTVA